MIQIVWAALFLVVDAAVVELEWSVAGVDGHWNRANISDGIGQLILVARSYVNESGIGSANSGGAKFTFTILLLPRISKFVFVLNSK